MLNAPQARQQFPALSHQVPPLFFDGAGGTQVPQQVIDAMSHYFIHQNAYHTGVFKTSLASTQLLDHARAAIADFLHANSKDEIIFGQNMTTLTLQISRAFVKQWGPGDEILVTRLDHDANISPWLLAAKDAGATVRYVAVDPEDCTLDMNALAECLNSRTRLLAVTAASNAVGTITDIKKISQMAHAVGALVYVDATHYAPHALIDVQAWQCDFLVCAAHKFFGPHLGILWGKREMLAQLSPYKVRPAPNHLPDNWMTGSPNNEGIAGTLSAVHYLAQLSAANPLDFTSDAFLTKRRALLQQTMSAIQTYEQQLTKKLLAALTARPHVKIWGISGPARLAERVPTIAFTLDGHSPKKIAEHLAAHHIYVWFGHFYAIELSEVLGLHQSGGCVRLSCVHYNTIAEIDRFMGVLDQLQ